MGIELDGEPRNRTIDSPNATRWRVGEAEIVADVDVATHGVRVTVSDRHVGDMTGTQNNHRFTLSTRAGYRGGEQADARILRDARTGALTLWVEGIEVKPFSVPDRIVPPPAPVQAPPTIQPLPFQRPDPPRRSGAWIVPVAIFSVVVVGSFLRWRSRNAEGARAATIAEIREQTDACLKRADQAATDAMAKQLAKNDPDSNMQAQTEITDRRRLARIACKEHERDCIRDPHGLACLMNK